jgi:hypothetical protein
MEPGDEILDELVEFTFSGILFSVIQKVSSLVSINIIPSKSLIEKLFQQKKDEAMQTLSKAQDTVLVRVLCNEVSIGDFKREVEVLYFAELELLFKKWDNEHRCSKLEGKEDVNAN